MIRRLLVLTAVTAAAVSVLAGTSQAKTIRPCKPNVQPGLDIVNKTNIIVFCGSAKATVKFGGKTYHFTNGACYKAVGSLNVGIGKYTTTITHTPYFTSLYLVVPASSDGTYRLGVLTVQFKGKSYEAAKVKVVVKGKRSHGSFAGKFNKGPTFTGTFTCK
jgi:hypothetical protein